MKDVNTKCLDIEKLKQRFPDQNYTSYCLILDKDDKKYSELIEPNIWPQGTLVKRWFLLGKTQSNLLR